MTQKEVEQPNRKDAMAAKGLPTQGRPSAARMVPMGAGKHRVVPRARVGG